MHSTCCHPSCFLCPVISFISSYLYYAFLMFLSRASSHVGPANVRATPDARDLLRWLSISCVMALRLHLGWNRTFDPPVPTFMHQRWRASEPGAMELIGSHVLCFLVIGVCLFLRIHFGCLHFNDHVWSVCIERCLGSTCKLSLPGMSGENEAAIHREVRLRALGTSSHPVSNICLYKGLLQTTLLKARFPKRFGLAFQHGVKWPE